MRAQYSNHPNYSCQLPQSSSNIQQHILVQNKLHSTMLLAMNISVTKAHESFPLWVAELFLTQLENIYVWQQQWRLAGFNCGLEDFIPGIEGLKRREDLSSNNSLQWPTLVLRRVYSLGPHFVLIYYNSYPLFTFFYSNQLHNALSCWLTASI